MTMQKEMRRIMSPAEKQDTGDQNCKSRMAKRKASPENRTPVKRRVTEPAGPSTSYSDIHVVKGVKRKAEQDGAGTTNQPKKSKLVDHISGDEEKVSSTLDTDKRKVMGDIKEPPKKKNKTVAQDKTKNDDQNSVADQKHEFQARYVQENQIGEGGCGEVFAGYRIRDHFPVAIKHIPEEKVCCKVTDENGKQLSVEVAIMLKLADEADRSVGTSAPVSLLDWFDLSTELILVLERPVPAVDLYEYVEENGGSLPEDKAKVILKQLVDAAKELEDKHIFHRDIKSENILMETGSDVPRVRIIDFGLSCFTEKQSLYHYFYGTSIHTPPEFYWHKEYRPGPTTVWQIGVVLYEVLHAGGFNTIMFLRNELEINKHLSTDCQIFLEACLTKVPEMRPTLEDLQLYPWLS